MTPATRGIFGIGLGIFMIALTVYFAHTRGAIYLLPCLLGPLLLPISFGLLVLPVEKLYKPTEIDGKVVYDTAGKSHTPLGWGLIVAGLIGSGALYLFLTEGFF
jgi:hypothetical protein